jgi:hypothetical protein
MQKCHYLRASYRHKYQKHRVFAGILSHHVVLSFAASSRHWPENIQSLLELILSTSEAKAGKSSNRAFWNSFCRLLEPRPESHQIEPPGTGFVDFWSQGKKVIKSSLLGPVLSTSGAKARKSSNRASWDWFCRLLEPRRGSHQIEPPGTGFVDFWSQGQKVIKSSLLGPVLSTSGANARKSSNRASWDWFCRLLEPRRGSHQIEPPGTGFVDFWSQGQKVIKSSLLGLVLSTSGAKARKSSNRASWD